MPPPFNSAPDDIAALRVALAAEQLARREAEARASGAEAMVVRLKLMIAKLRHERFGASSERGSKLLDQLELQLEELEAAAAEDEAVLDPDTAEHTGRRPLRRKPVRGPLPPPVFQHLRCRNLDRLRPRICRASGWWFAP